MCQVGECKPLSTHSTTLSHSSCDRRALLGSVFWCAQLAEGRSVRGARSVSVSSVTSACTIQTTSTLPWAPSPRFDFAV